MRGSADALWAKIILTLKRRGEEAHTNRHGGTLVHARIPKVNRKGEAR